MDKYQKALNELSNIVFDESSDGYNEPRTLGQFFFNEFDHLQELVDKKSSNSLLNVTVREIEDLLIDAEESIKGGHIYDHGYPEARLIPANFESECEGLHTEFVCEKVCEIVKEYLNEIYPKGWVGNEL